MVFIKVVSKTKKIIGSNVRAQCPRPADAVRTGWARLFGRAGLGHVKIRNRGSNCKEIPLRQPADRDDAK